MPKKSKTSRSYMFAMFQRSLTVGKKGFSLSVVAVFKLMRLFCVVDQRLYTTPSPSSPQSIPVSVSRKSKCSSSFSRCISACKSSGAKQCSCNSFSAGFVSVGVAAGRAGCGAAAACGAVFARSCFIVCSFSIFYLKNSFRGSRRLTPLPPHSRFYAFVLSFRPMFADLFLSGWSYRRSFQL